MKPWRNAGEPQSKDRGNPGTPVSFDFAMTQVLPSPGILPSQQKNTWGVHRARMTASPFETQRSRDETSLQSSPTNVPLSLFLLELVRQSSSAGCHLLKILLEALTPGRAGQSKTCKTLQGTCSCAGRAAHHPDCEPADNEQAGSPERTGVGLRDAWLWQDMTSDFSFPPETLSLSVCPTCPAKCDIRATALSMPHSQREKEPAPHRVRQGYWRKGGYWTHVR
jgi:hypothetical protein